MQDTNFDPQTYGNISQSEIDNAMQKSKIENPKKIYRGLYYTQDKIRLLVYEGKKDEEDVILKIWNDPREMYEPLDLKAFNQVNQSQILKAPRVIDYELPNMHQGWLLIEKIDSSKNVYTDSPNQQDKQRLIELFIEYRQNYPSRPAREVPELEKLPASEYHLTRIARWEKLARKKNWLEEKYYNLITQAKETIKQKFSDTNMVWCHGMFVNENIFKVGNIYYLTAFQHGGFKPNGYELSMIVWKSLIEGIERHHTITTQEQFDQKIEEWFEIFEQNKLIDPSPSESPDDEGEGDSDVIITLDLFNACLLERACGTILADIGASDREERTKTITLNMWSKLLTKLLNSQI